MLEKLGEQRHCKSNLFQSEGEREGSLWESGLDYCAHKKMWQGPLESSQQGWLSKESHDSQG